MIIFTDLDGTLLDGETYSWETAREALDAVRSRHIPVVLVSSKTRAEIEPLREQLRLDAPFVVENGGGIFIPRDYFPFSIDGAVLRQGYFVVDLGVPYPLLRTVVADVRQSLGIDIRGFGDMSVEEVARQTGLSLANAELAKQREYDEPFKFSGSKEAVERLRGAIEVRGLRCVSGGRFFHLMGTQDKGHATSLLTGWYRKHLPDDLNRGFQTVGFGDGPNDLTMLAAVDRPYLLQRPDGSHDDRVKVEGLNLVPAPGPIGWNRAVLNLLRENS